MWPCGSNLVSAFQIWTRTAAEEHVMLRCRELAWVPGAARSVAILTLACPQSLISVFTANITAAFRLWFS